MAHCNPVSSVFRELNNLRVIIDKIVYMPALEAPPDRPYPFVYFITIDNQSVETVTISLKGQEKKQQHFQVQNGPDGKPQKTPLDSAPAAQSQQQSSGRGGRLRQRVVEKKKEEYEEYAERMKALAEQYVPPDKDLIQAAYAKGNISMTPGPGGLKLVIHNYVKPDDSMTLTIDKEQKALQSIQIASYMDGPSDGMNLTVRFDRLPDGTNHVSSTTVEGVSKQLTVATQNGNYQKR